jgi:predicted dehydrogenase
MEITTIGIGLVGYGYWGPNLARNFSNRSDCKLVAIFDQDPKQRRKAAARYPQTLVTDNYAEMLGRSDIQAILIATPVFTHFELAKQALTAGKDVLIEKPITRTVEEARELIGLAKAHDRILAVDHTFLFTGAIRKIKEIIDSGHLGNLLYLDSVRTNLGKFQEDINVIYDLAPHDLSILNHLFTFDPVSVQAMGACHSGAGIENIAYLHVEYPGDIVAHCHFNWLAPVKIRKMLIAGSEKMIVYDDMESTDKVKIYDMGITVVEDREDVIKRKIDYRTGDMWSPKLIHREALDYEAEQFLDCVRTRKQPLCTGEDGLKVLRIIEAAQRSLEQCGAKIPL